MGHVRGVKSELTEEIQWCHVFLLGKVIGVNLSC